MSRVLHAAATALRESQPFIRAHLAWRVLRGRPVCYRMVIRDGAPTTPAVETAVHFTGTVTFSGPLVLPFGVTVRGQ